MDAKYIVVGVLCVVVIILILSHKEGFANKHEKTGAIAAWFNSQKAPTYTKYKADIGEGSNIVEYEDALAQFHRGALSVESLANIVR